MIDITTLTKQALDEFLKGLCPLCDGWKQVNNVSNTEFIAIVQCFSTLLNQYYKENKTNALLIESAINDFNYSIGFLAERWSHKQNSDVPTKFMQHNPICNKWRKNTAPDNAEITVICEAIQCAINTSMQMQEFTRYRFINELTGGVLYLMNIDVVDDHENLIDKKKSDLAHKKNIEYSNVVCEVI